LARRIVLNVNVPYLTEAELKGYMVTRQGLRVYRDVLDKRMDPRGRPYYWIGGEAPTSIAEEGTDAGALAEGYVSLTPLQLDLTHYKAMDTLRKGNRLVHGGPCWTPRISPAQLLKLRRFHCMNHFMVFMEARLPDVNMWPR
jgi:hypothetical protein